MEIIDFFKDIDLGWFKYASAFSCSSNWLRTVRCCLSRDIVQLTCVQSNVE